LTFAFILSHEREGVIQWVTEKGRKKLGTRRPLSLSLFFFITLYVSLSLFLFLSISLSISFSLWCWYLASLEYFVQAQLNGRS
jgi:hypothetical protein